MSSEKGDRYLQAWDAVGKLLDAGRSWSGRERNCAFLNTGDGRFVGVAGLLGLDQDYDSRALAVVDWDRDGDQDLWVSNRNGSRVRFLRNDIKQSNRSIAIRLEGTASNRDAIGARVTFFMKGTTESSMIKTVRAGEGYLSQTSKWLLFPLPEGHEMDFVQVNWPGGKQERFDGLQLGARMRLVEGTARASLLVDPPQPEIRSSSLVLPTPTDAARIIPHARLPLPTLNYFDIEGREASVSPDQGEEFVLLTLWASWCSPCLGELQELQANADQLKQRGITVLAVNIEDLEKDASGRATLVQRFLKKNRLLFRAGLGTSDLVEVLDVVQRTILGRQKSLPIPSSFLLDKNGDLIAIYKGRFEFQQMLADANAVGKAGTNDRDAALPFPGRWYVHPFAPDLFALPEKLLEASNEDAVFNYLQQHLGLGLARQGVNEDGSVLGATQIESRDRNAGRLYQKVGNRFAQKKRFKPAAEAFESALVFDPESYEIREKLAVTLQAQGADAKALIHLEELQRRRPGQVPVLNSLAWILASSGESSLRNASKAISYAQEACSLTQNQSAETLDTLAAAYAAAGQFSAAIESAGLALERAQESGDKKVMQAIEARLEYYREGQPFRSSSPNQP